LTALSSAQRDIARLAITETLNINSESWPINKSDLDLIIEDIDIWFDSEIVNMNLAIATALRSTLSTAQELQIMAQVATTRSDEGVT